MTQEQAVKRGGQTWREKQAWQEKQAMLLAEVCCANFAWHCYSASLYCLRDVCTACYSSTIVVLLVLQCVPAVSQLLYSQPARPATTRPLQNSSTLNRRSKPPVARTACGTSTHDSSQFWCAQLLCSLPIACTVTCCHVSEPFASDGATAAHTHAELHPANGVQPCQNCCHRTQRQQHVLTHVLSE